MHDAHPQPSEKKKTFIRVKNLGVRYRRYKSRPDTLKDFVLNAFRPPPFEEFWALRRVSFTVAKGESVGVIGANGSGKSTLLKALAGIIPPTRGRVVTVGRVAPLIELGAGFNPELTGRENVFLNGAIMGFSRSEIKKRLPAITEFAGIGDFMDVPLKNYSSGMKSRLGFAVASDIKPSILLLDEIFAVGDAVFRARAKERTERFLASNTTVVMVSHNIKLMTRFCKRMLYLRGGKLIADGPSSEVSKLYAKHVRKGLAQATSRETSD